MALISQSDRHALGYIAEEMADLVFDDAVLDRLEKLGLAARRAGTWIVTEAGRAALLLDAAAAEP